MFHFFSALGVYLCLLILTASFFTNSKLPEKVNTILCLAIPAAIMASPFVLARIIPDRSIAEPNVTTVGDAPDVTIHDYGILDADYILNKNTNKFHYPDCSSVQRMERSNMELFDGERKEVIDMGYEPCGRCNP